jgi:hypothetical protein
MQALMSSTTLPQTLQRLVSRLLQLTALPALEVADGVDASPGSEAAVAVASPGSEAAATLTHASMDFMVATAVVAIPSTVAAVASGLATDAVVAAGDVDSQFVASHVVAAGAAAVAADAEAAGMDAGTESAIKEMVVERT